MSLLVSLDCWWRIVSALWFDSVVLRESVCANLCSYCRKVFLVAFGFLVALVSVLVASHFLIAGSAGCDAVVLDYSSVG